MDNPTYAARPPLRLWLLLAIATGGMLLFIFQQHQQSVQYSDASIDRFLNGARGSAKPVVLIIGTSLTEAGLDSTARIQRCLVKRTGSDVLVLKCWKPNTDLASFVAVHNAAFRRLRPSLVVLEANMLFYRPLSQPVLSRYMQTFRDLVNGRSRRAYEPDARPLIAATGRAAVAGFRAGLADTTQLRPFRDICAGWQEQGTQIVLLNFPLEKELEDRKWTSPDTALFFRNRHFLEARGQIPLLDKKFRLDSSYFFDFSHLNSKGNSAFASWFCETISAEINAGRQIHKTGDR